MARGRMLNKKVSDSLPMHNLPDDTCRLLASWLIAHLDKRGVFYGSATMIKSKVFPRRDDLSHEQIESHLQAMEAVIVDGKSRPLIVRFKARGDVWLHCPGFIGEQVGLRADRETTTYPHPPGVSAEDSGNLPDDSRKDAGENPAEGKLSEGKLSECAGKKPATLEQWLYRVDSEKNKNAVLASLFVELYAPRQTPSYRKIGAIAKKVPGKHGRLAELMWSCAEEPPSGDILAYCLACTKGDVKRPQRDMKHDINTIKEAKKQHSLPGWDAARADLDAYQIAMVNEAGGWHTLCGMYANASDAKLRDAWYRLREKQ